MNFKSLVAITLITLSCFSMAADQSEKEDLKVRLNSIQDELNELVNKGGKYAYLQLIKNNHFSPFAVGVSKDGSALMLEVPPQDQEVTIADKVLKLREMLKLAADNNKIEVGALFAQAEVPHKGKILNGIAIELEHRRGLSVVRFAPYEIDQKNKKITFKKTVDKIKPTVFFTKKKEVTTQELAKSGK